MGIIDVKYYTISFRFFNFFNLGNSHTFYNTKAFLCSVYIHITHLPKIIAVFGSIYGTYCKPS